MKKYLKLFMIALLCVAVALPTSTLPASASSSRVRVTYKGKTKNYRKRKNYVYVQGSKKKISSTPIFIKSGAYEGPASKIFKSLGVSLKSTSGHKKLVMTYGDNQLILKNGSRRATINGRSTAVGAAAFFAYYKHSKKRAWVVPLKSVCLRLGLSYEVRNGKVMVSKPATTKSSSGPVASNGKVVIVLDAGHGGSDSGAVSGGIAEKALTLRIVLAAKQFFDRDPRFTVYYTRTSDTYPSLSDRYNLANKNNADLFLCVHINCAGSTSAHGTETLYSAPRNAATAKNGLSSYELAKYMQSATLAATGFRDRGLVSRPNLAVLKHTLMPACLIEYGFISNSAERSKMNSHTSYYGQQLYNAVVSLSQSKGMIR